jgi:hypothetical protein
MVTKNHCAPARLSPRNARAELETDRVAPLALSLQRSLERDFRGRVVVEEFAKAAAWTPDPSSIPVNVHRSGTPRGGNITL